MVIDVVVSLLITGRKHACICFNGRIYYGGELGQKKSAFAPYLFKIFILVRKY